jgi:hypothetical protein
MDSQQLMDAVEAAFESTGADTPGWPDPHPGMAAPARDEYSRCLDPERLRIVRARVDAWVIALTDSGLAETSVVSDVTQVWGSEASSLPSERALRVRPLRSGAVPLVVGFRSVDGVADSVIDLGFGEPAVQVTWLPECGCDACDDGSGPLLDRIDDNVMAIVSGEMVHVRTDMYTVTATGFGLHASGNPPGSLRSPDEIAEVLQAARAGLLGEQAVLGAPWW